MAVAFHAKYAPYTQQQNKTVTYPEMGGRNDKYTNHKNNNKTKTTNLTHRRIALEEIWCPLIKSSYQQRHTKRAHTPATRKELRITLRHGLSPPFKC